MKTTLRKPMLKAMAAFLVLCSAASQAQITDPPVPLPGTAIGPNSFVANWEPVPAATSYGLDVSTSPTFGNPILATDLIISEYIEGSAGYRAIELYNGTGADVNLAGYTIRKETNGAGTFTQISINGVLPNNSTWVIAFGSGAAADVQPHVNLTVLSQTFDGNDAILLRKSGVIIDAVGFLGQAAMWGADVTLRRKSSVTAPTASYSPDDWDAYPINNVADLGSHTMTTFIPSFVPGYEDLTVNGTSQLVSGLTSETDYYYRVRTVDADGTSVNSTPTIHVRTLALPTFGSVTQAPGVVCEDSAATFNLDGLTPDSTYSISYNIDGGATQVVTDILVDGAGHATFEVVLSLVNNGQTLTVTEFQRTDVPTDPELPTANNTVVLNVAEIVTYYADSDLDGYGDANNTIESCVAVAGYVLDNTDCNDAAAAIHPGATEVLYNGIDENCDGNLDEGAQYVTQIVPSQCGTTLSPIYDIIWVTPRINASRYRFEVTDVETSEVQIIENQDNKFTLTMLPSYDYQKTYSVRVMIRFNLTWLGYYGPACTISSPQVLDPGGAASVNPLQCNSVIPKISTMIATTSLPTVTGYRFRVTNISDPSAPNQVQTVDHTLNWFSLTMLPSFNYGATYTVEVAVRTTGDYTAYGSPCQVTAPPVPSLTNCGETVATATSMITTASKDRVTMYRFIVTNLENNEVTTIDNTLNWFRFSQLPDYVPGGLYNVKVAVMTAGYFSLPGEGCEITAPGGAPARMNKKELTPDAENIVFEAKAYPNPFSESFSIEATTTSEADFSIKVYDMTGRLLEDRKATLSDMQTLTLGENYPTGIYNVILMQGESVKTIRVIRR